MQFIANILCPPLNRVIFNKTAKSIRITVLSLRKPPQRCIGYVNIVNAVTHVINSSISFDYIGKIGRLVNGIWDGAIGQVVNNKSDIAIGKFTATYERSQWTQSSSMMGYGSPIAILSGKIPKHSLQNEFQVFDTFSSNVWLMLFLSVLIVGLINYFVHNSKWKFNFILSSMIQIYKSALVQHVKQFGRVCCSKHIILIGMSLLSFNILIQYFRSLILTNLLNDPLIKIDSIDDLVNLLKSTKHNISLVSSKSILTWSLLENSKDEKFKMIFNKLQDSPITLNDLINGKGIMINYGEFLDIVVNLLNHPNLHVSRQQYFGSAFVILYSKSFEKALKDKIDSVIIILFESGLFNFWNSIVAFRRLNWNEIEDRHTITLENIRGLIMLMIIIYLAIFLIVIIENLFKMFFYN